MQIRCQCDHGYADMPPGRQKGCTFLLYSGITWSGPQKHLWDERGRVAFFGVHEEIEEKIPPINALLLARSDTYEDCQRIIRVGRLVRNARTSSSVHFHITLFGVAPHVAAYLNLTSSSPGG